MNGRKLMNAKNNKYQVLNKLMVFSWANLFMSEHDKMSRCTKILDI
jgi:hypothetical protein